MYNSSISGYTTRTDPTDLGCCIVLLYVIHVIVLNQSTPSYCGLSRKLRNSHEYNPPPIVTCKLNLLLPPESSSVHNDATLATGTSRYIHKKETTSFVCDLFEQRKRVMAAAAAAVVVNASDNVSSTPRAKVRSQNLFNRI